MSIDAYTTGTVLVTNGSATVTGTGTTFTAAMVGRYFKVNTEPTWYRIASFTSTTVVVLENVYEGATATGAAYTIAEAFGLPEDLQILPVYYAVWHYFSSKRDERAKKEYEDLFMKQLELGKIRHATKTSGSVARPRNRFSRFKRATPGYFPTSAT
ncbi:MAG: hypothetical protein QME66_04145 [Candidatus Eisenbacteria bacterium]|nr:hypothetical protein [Candidatus Eisenbacteria bacterium]